MLRDACACQHLLPWSGQWVVNRQRGKRAAAYKAFAFCAPPSRFKNKALGVFSLFLGHRQIKFSAWRPFGLWRHRFGGHQKEPVR